MHSMRCTCHSRSHDLQCYNALATQLDVLTHVCRYEKYAAKPDAPVDRPPAGADKFMDEYFFTMSQIKELSKVCAARHCDALTDSQRVTMAGATCLTLGNPGCVCRQRAQEAGEEKNRAVRAALNADLRCVLTAVRAACAPGPPCLRNHIRRSALSLPAATDVWYFDVDRRGKAALVEGNLAKLNKLVRKGKTDADVLEDRLQKARIAHTAWHLLQGCRC